jgi:hypothetical protein
VIAAGTVNSSTESEATRSSQAADSVSSAKPPPSASDSVARVASAPAWMRSSPGLASAGSALSSAAITRRTRSSIAT